MLVRKRVLRPTLTTAALAAWVWAIGALLLLAVAVAGAGVYGQNDDWGIASSLTGAFGNPGGDFAVPFIGPALAWLIWFASGIAPAIGWYGVYTSLLAITAIAVLVAISSETAPKALGMRFVGSTLVGSIMMIWMLLQPTFTVAALLAGGAAGLLACRSLSSTRPKPPLLVSALLGLLGAWLRFDAAALGFLTVLPTMLVIAVLSRPKAARLGQVALAGGATLALLFATNAAASALQHTNPMWDSYTEWNSVRGAIYGTPAGDALADRLEEAGWSKLDYDSFRLGLNLDRQTPSTAELAKAWDVTADTRWTSDAQRSALMINRGVRAANKELSASLSYFLLIVAICAIAIFYPQGAKGSRRQLMLTGVAQATWVLLLIIVLGGSTRIPGRILIPMLALLPFAALSMSIASPRWNPQVVSIKCYCRSRDALIISLVCALLVFVFSPFGILQMRKSNSTHQQWREASDRAMAASAVPASFSCLLGDEWAQSPYGRVQSGSVPALYFGWAVSSPAWIRTAQKIGVNPENLAEAFATNRLNIWCSLGQARVIERYVKSQGYPKLHLCGGIPVARFCAGDDERLDPRVAPWEHKAKKQSAKKKAQGED